MKLIKNKKINYNCNYLPNFKNITFILIINDKNENKFRFTNLKIFKNEF